MSEQPLFIENDCWRIGVSPRWGASITHAAIRYDDQWLDFMRPSPATITRAGDCASFVMIPWSNRVKDGRFIFEGQTYQMKPNNHDGSAIHGIGRYHPWLLEAHQDVYEEGKRIVCTFDSADHEHDFPFQFAARQVYEIQADTLILTTTLLNKDNRSMPAGFGHHPYFMRTLTGPADSLQITIPCSQYFELNNAIPTGLPQPIPPVLDFRTARPPGNESLDVCLTGFDTAQPVTFHYQGSGVRVEMQADDTFTCVILFTPTGKDHIAVEPATNANDGFNLYSAGIDGSGVFVLEPGESRTGVVRFQLQ